MNPSEEKTLSTSAPGILLATCAQSHDFPIPLKEGKEIVLVGRSNVGKSSLLNSILGTKIAKTSQTPGKTQLINFYQRHNYIFVDLPGFGYSAVSGKTQELFASRVEAYFQARRATVALFLLDIRREPREQDCEILASLKAWGMRVEVVLTKADKVATTKRSAMIKKYASFLGITPQLMSVEDPNLRQRFQNYLEHL